MDGQRGVAEPAKTVVPVSYAADFLGKRRGGSSDNPSGRSVCQRLQSNERAQDGVTPSPFVSTLSRPIAPVGFGRRQCSSRIESIRNTAIGGSPTGNERDRLTLLYPKQGRDSRGARLHFNR